jgi:putative spermidine/putrescine transport system substrate-binding protein/spermidine/putrescine transport system substrate-binding protein
MLRQICTALIIILVPYNSIADTIPDKIVIRIVGWDVYADPEHPNKTIGYESFEQQFNVQIEFTPLSNLDAIVNTAELDSDYDVFIISNEGIRILYDMGLVQPLELNKLTHYQDLHHSLRYNEWSQFNGKLYAIPWAWGPTGLLYDTDKIPEPDSWNILWDPAYKGKVSLWDDVSMIWITALSLGYTNVYNLTRPQLDKIKKKLLALNTNIHTYYNGGQEAIQSILDDEVTLLNSWFDPSRRLQDLGRNFKMVIPKEGAVGMFDSYLISNHGHSQHSNLIHQFIDHQISPAIQQRMVRITGLPPANIETLALLTPDEIRALHLDEGNYFNRMILWNTMPRKHLYEEILTEVRANLKSTAKTIPRQE